MGLLLVAIITDSLFCTYIWNSTKNEKKKKYDSMQLVLHEVLHDYIFKLF